MSRAAASNEAVAIWFFVVAPFRLVREMNPASQRSISAAYAAESPESVFAPVQASLKIAMACEGSGVGSGNGVAAACDTRSEAVDAASSTDSKMSEFLVISLRLNPSHHRDQV